VHVSGIGCIKLKHAVLLTNSLGLKQLQAVHCEAGQRNPNQRQQQLNLQHNAPHNLQDVQDMQQHAQAMLTTVLVLLCMSLQLMGQKPHFNYFSVCFDSLRQ
jgi:hypothetical protein